MYYGIIYSIKGILSSLWGEVLFVSIDSSICGIVIKGESSISDVSFFSGAKVIPAFINSTPNVRAAINVMRKYFCFKRIFNNNLF